MLMFLGVCFFWVFFVSHKHGLNDLQRTSVDVHLFYPPLFLFFNQNNDFYVSSLASMYNMKQRGVCVCACCWETLLSISERCVEKNKILPTKEDLKHTSYTSEVRKFSQRK